MSDLKLPKAWVTAGKKDTKKVEARIDMSAEVAGQGLCPDCRAPMERAIPNVSQFQSLTTWCNHGQGTSVRREPFVEEKEEKEINGGYRGQAEEGEAGLIRKRGILDSCCELRTDSGVARLQRKRQSNSSGVPNPSSIVGTNVPIGRVLRRKD